MKAKVAETIVVTAEDLNITTRPCPYCGTEISEHTLRCNCEKQEKQVVKQGKEK